MVFPDGSEKLLDEILGPGFSLLGFECDPADEVPATVMARFEEIGAQTAAVSGARNASKWPRDPGGKLDELFRGEAGTMALIRPDRFIVSAFTRDSAAEGLAASEKALSLNG